MSKFYGVALLMVLLAGMEMGARIVYADDFSDGMGEYTEDAISADDSIGGNKATNINYIVVDALGKSMSKREKDGSDKGTSKGNSVSNLNDGSGDNNQNSVVVGPGSNVDKIYNIVIQK
jgi:hypothetical protein